MKYSVDWWSNPILRLSLIDKSARIICTFIRQVTDIKLCTKCKHRDRQSKNGVGGGLLAYPTNLDADVKWPRQQLGYPMFVGCSTN